MKEMPLEEVLKLQVEILAKVDAFCRDHSILYTVDGGTCIGTVRHKGYIPWDDDIDIAMTRPNYDRFIHSFNGNFEELVLYAPELDWNYYAPYANVCDNRTVLYEGANRHNGMDIGVKIDVFPIDGVASDLSVYHRYSKLLKLLWRLLFVKRYDNNTLIPRQKKAFLKYSIIKLISSPLRYSFIQQLINKLATKFPYDTAEFVEDFVMPWPHDVRCSRQAFEEYEDAQFEDITVSILKGYDEYLTKLYGDYMKLPPEEKRVNHHNFKAFWKES